MFVVRRARAIATPRPIWCGARAFRVDGSGRVPACPRCVGADVQLAVGYMRRCWRPSPVSVPQWPVRADGEFLRSRRRSARREFEEAVGLFLPFASMSWARRPAHFAFTGAASWRASIHVTALRTATQEDAVHRDACRRLEAAECRRDVAGRDVGDLLADELPSGARGRCSMSNLPPTVQGRAERLAGALQLSGRALEFERLGLAVGDSGWKAAGAITAGLARRRGGRVPSRSCWSARGGRDRPPAW